MTIPYEQARANREANQKKREDTGRSQGIADEITKAEGEMTLYYWEHHFTALVTMNGYIYGIDERHAGERLRWWFWKTHEARIESFRVYPGHVNILTTEGVVRP